jgi:uncharacterized protein DUF6982
MPERKRHKVVAHLKNGSLVKGYFESPLEDISALIPQGIENPFPSKLSLQMSTGETAEANPTNIFLDEAKALFFVDSFEGNKDYSEVKFFEATPRAEGLWVRIMFQDQEVIEGIVHNSLPFVADRGFFLKPPDPQSNNKMIYVVKNAMREFRVLGVRNKY